MDDAHHPPPARRRGRRRRRTARAAHHSRRRRPPAHATADVCVVGAGPLRASPPRAPWSRPTARSSSSRRATASAGGRSTRRSAAGTSPRSAASTSARRRTGSSRWRDAVGVKTLPDLQRRLNVLTSRAGGSLYAAVPGLPDDPDVQQAILASRSSTPWPSRPACARPGRPRRPELGPATLDDWMRTESPQRRAARSSSSACQAIWGADPSELSLLYALQYTAAAGNAKTPGSFLRLVTTAGGAQERRFVGGSQLISEKVADRLGSRVVPPRARARRGPERRRRPGRGRRHDGRGAPA